MRTPGEEMDRIREELAALEGLEGRLVAWKPHSEPSAFARDGVVGEIRSRIAKLRSELELQRQLGILLTAMGDQPPGG